MADYLKKSLATNIPAIVTMKKRLGEQEEKDFKTKEPTGRKEYGYVFTLEDGREVLH